MHKMTLISRWKIILGTAVCAALVSGCGNGSNIPTDPVASTDISADVGALIAYMERLIGMDGNSDGVDVNAVKLVQDETSEPTAVKF